jgi:hypothetical protein
MGLETTEGLATTFDKVRLQPPLPLAYVAWADLELSGDEVEGICQIVAQKTEIDFDCQMVIPQAVLGAPIAANQKA